MTIYNYTKKTQQCGRGHFDKFAYFFVTFIVQLTYVLMISTYFYNYIITAFDISNLAYSPGLDVCLEISFNICCDSPFVIIEGFGCFFFEIYNMAPYNYLLNQRVVWDLFSLNLEIYEQPESLFMPTAPHSTTLKALQLFLSRAPFNSDVLISCTLVIEMV